MATRDAVAKLEVPEDEEFRRLTHMQRAVMRLRKDRLTLIALGVVFFMVFMSFVGPTILEAAIGVDTESENLSNTFAPPGTQVNPTDPEDTRVHYLGTDDKGRDYFARLMAGGQISLKIAFFAALLSISIGVSLGIYTGYFGGAVDDFMIWFITTFNSIPPLFLLLIVSAIFRENVRAYGTNVPQDVVFILVLGLLGWTGTMRLVRGETLALREREYIIAAQALGASSVRIMFRHIFPNLISIVVIALAIDIGVLILVESGLSYLGFGINPPTPTWGNMLTDAQKFMTREPPAQHLVVIPGILISVTVLCFYIIGDGLRDALDPTARD